MKELYEDWCKPEFIRRKKYYQEFIEPQKHKAMLEIKFGLVGHPKADELYESAWKVGHPDGYDKVEVLYADMAELLMREEIGDNPCYSIRSHNARKIL